MEKQDKPQMGKTQNAKRAVKSNTLHSYKKLKRNEVKG